MVPRMNASRSTQSRLAERWLWLGVTALAVAGLFAVLLVVARTPQLKELTVVQSLFNVALVVHVDLSVLMWFLAILGMGIAGMMQAHEHRWPYWSKAALATAAASTVLMALSPLDPEWEVIKSNYIPVLFNWVFFLSLGLLAASLVVLLVPFILTYASPRALSGLNLVERGWWMAGVATLLALLGFGLSGHYLPPDLPHDTRFETLFWAGGHILQFTYTLLMMVAWIALLEAMGRNVAARGFVTLTYALTLLGAIVSLAGFALYPFDSGEFTYHQTWVMIHLGGIGCGLLSLYVLVRMLKRSASETRLSRTTRAYGSCLVMSLVLFGTGGVLGLMISGQNVGIPAHYHGQIVGVTLALMGLAYTMLPRFGYASVAHTRMAFWQPIAYGVGQLMHIGGLAYSGGYGVLRKTAGGFENLTPEVKAALGVMGAGGLIAIIGGILFVVVMLRARRTAAHAVA
jgi:cytochrome c oxidase subunit 1